MKIHSLETDFIIALYTYLRQAELSIDRGLGSSWENLRRYYQADAIHPKIVVSTLLELSEECSDKIPITLLLKKPRSYFRKRKTIFVRLYKFWNWYFKHTLRLDEDEFIFIFHSLYEFEKILPSHNKTYHPNM